MITHSAFVNIHNKDQNLFDTIFKDTKTLTQLSNKIIKASKSFANLSYPSSDKLKGDLFEIFAESFFKLLSSDNRIGVYNYQPAPPVDDYGVDGFGLGIDRGKKNELYPCTIQVKFRSNKLDELKLNDIKNFQGISYRVYKVPIDTNDNLILFTNAKGLHWITEAKVLSGACRVIGNNEISKLIDNNPVFWSNLNDLILETIKLKYN